MKITKKTAGWLFAPVLVLVGFFSPVGLPALFAGNAVHIRVEGDNKTYFDGQVDTSNCTVTDAGGQEHALPAVAACALLDALTPISVPAEFVDYGFGLFLNSIGSDTTPSDFSKSWSYWVNDQPASVGLDQYLVEPGDDILVAFSAYPAVPLRLAASATVATGEKFTVKIEQLVGEYDDQFTWHGGWQAANSAQLHINSSPVNAPASGLIDLVFETPQELTVWASGEGLIKSAEKKLTVTTPSPTPTPTPPTVYEPSPSPTPVSSPTPTPSPTPSPSPVLSPTFSPTPAPVTSVNDGTLTEASLRAEQYLRQRQTPDGSIDGEMVSAWSAIAFGAAGQSACAIANGEYTLCSVLAGTNFSRTTDLERQILAIRAAGENPYTFARQNFVSDLKTRFNNHQLGETNLFNDDIFGILALLAAGEPTTSHEIEEPVQWIIGRQGTDGSWENIDLTAAAVQALQAYSKQGGQHNVASSINSARQYLLASQDEFGGFGRNSASTSWTIQAILSLGENPSDWVNKSNFSPWHALLRYQNNDGGFAWQSGDDSSAFMTAYAITALRKKAWPVAVLPVLPTAYADQNYLPPAITPAMPQVAGINTGNGLSTSAVPQATSGQSSSSTAAPAGAKVLLRPAGAPQNPPAASALTKNITPRESDFQFTIAGFSLANISIGFFISKILLKLT